MKKPLALLLLHILAIATPALAGTILKLEERETGSEPQLMTVSVDGQRVAIDTGEESNRVLFFGDRQQMLVINDAERTFTLLDEASMRNLAGQMSSAMKQMEEALAQLPPEQRAMAERMMRQQMPQASAGASAAKSQSAAKVERTREREDREGYPCVKYEVFENDVKVRELWVTDWSKVGGQAELAGAMRSMATFAQSMMASLAALPGAEGPSMQASIAYWDKIEGFPVVTVELENGAPTTETALRSIEKADLDEALFAQPQDYVQQMLPGQQPQ